jgi:hypothetical protein
MKIRKVVQWTMALILAVGAGIMVSASARQETGNTTGQAWLSAMDPDHDGTVSQDELRRLHERTVQEG